MAASCCTTYAVILALVFLCQTLSSAAPLSSIWNQLGSSDDETKVSVVFSGKENSADDMVHALRTKRSAAHAPVDDGYDPLAAIDADDTLSPGQRRQRRSAVLYLHASMHFCKNYPNMCRRIEVDEGDVRLKVRLEDM